MAVYYHNIDVIATFLQLLPGDLAYDLAYGLGLIKRW
jgi:hypothetical protein